MRTSSTEQRLWHVKLKGGRTWIGTEQELRQQHPTWIPYARPYQPEPQPESQDLTTREAFVIAPVLALIIALGVYPKPLLDTITPAVKATFSTTGHADPVPPHPVQAENQGASR